MLQKVRLKHEKCLELDSVLKIVSQEAGFGDSVERILALEPKYNYEDALNALKKTGDAYDIAAKFGTPRVSGVKNVSNALKRAKSGGNLSLSELLDIGEVLRNVRGIAQFREQFSGVETSLDQYFDSLFPNKYFEEKTTIKIIYMLPFQVRCVNINIAYYNCSYCAQISYRF